jgi:hypothetical protein
MKKAFIITTVLAIVLITVIAITPGGAQERLIKGRTCLPGLCDAERTQGLKAPAPKGDYELVTLKGPGTFVSAQITKQGGTNDLTFIILDLDGKNIVDYSMIAAENAGLTQANPYGIVCLKSAAGLKTLTIGYPYPLSFEKELKLKVSVGEDNVVQILANVIHGK